MWKWIEDQLEASDNFDYLLVAGHYQILDSYGYYDKALTKHLLPLLKKYKAQAYIQAHRVGSVKQLKYEILFKTFYLILVIVEQCQVQK